MNKMRIRSLITGMIASAAIGLAGNIAIAQIMQETSGAKEVNAGGLSSNQARAELAARLSQSNVLKKGRTNLKASVDRATAIVDELSDDRVMSAMAKSTHEELEAAMFGSQAARDLLSSLVDKRTSVAGIIKTFGDSNADLVFTPVQPCRIMDTRLAVGALTANVDRSFDISAAAITAQGGVPSGGCGIPAVARAISVNITVIGVGAGYLFIWPDTFPIPNASILNFSPATGGPIANAAVVSIFPSNPAGHLEVQPGGTTGTHVIMDVLGYFAAPVSGVALNCVNSAINTVATTAGNIFNVSPNACPSGYTKVSVGCRSGGYNTSEWTSMNGIITGGSADCQGHANVADTITATARCCKVP